MELCKLGVSAMDSGLVEKLSGDNSKEEKERVMDLFKNGYVQYFFQKLFRASSCAARAAWPLITLLFLFFFLLLLLNLGC